ncbi:MAG: RNA methyltransferase [Desulfuromonadales bacterium]|nr:RNA methyltransferase [Desulfuromonadales bacterium]
MEPQGPRNIGSVARAMANFGMNDLRLVQPQTDHLQEEARQMAVKAGGILEQARICPDLQTALADCHCAFGTTRRLGKYRVDILNPDDAALQVLPLLEEGRVAMVFGREDRGLKTEEIDLCQRLVTIPTDDRLPSMNLAQSVGICLYEVYRQHGRALGKTTGGKKLAEAPDVEAMFAHMHQTFLDIDYLNPQNPEHILRTYRRLLGRAGLDPREVRALRGLLSSIDWVESERRRLAEKDEDETV